MKTNNRWALNALLFIAMGVSSMAHAALVGRLAATAGGTDYQAYYDTDANLTWLADMNYAKTTGYASAHANGGDESVPTNIQTDGRMGWQAATNWATQLTVGGVGGWRLPDVDTTCIIYECRNGEVGNLYYTVLGNPSGSGGGHMEPFRNMQNFDSYWTASTSHPVVPNYAWYYGMGIGEQNSLNKNRSFYAWAVHSGDVKPPAPPVSAVPVPAAIWLFGSGLMGLVGLAKRKTLRLAV